MTKRDVDTIILDTAKQYPAVVDYMKTQAKAPTEGDIPWLYRGGVRRLAKQAGVSTDAFLKRAWEMARA
jgi:hypothetical protein